MKTNVLKIASSFILVFLLQSFFSSGQSDQSEAIFKNEKSTPKLKIVSTTSLIGNIVKKIGREKVQVVTIIPEGMCPGHFDIRPGDVKVLEEAQLLLEHGFAGELFVKDMLKLVENKNLLKITLNVKGNWMVPEVQIEALDKIVEILCQIKPEDANTFQKNAQDYKEAVANLAREIQCKMKELGIGEIKVACSEMQSQFVDWLGFNIILTYGRPDDFSPALLKKMIKKGKSEGIKLVIDNLQSGAKAGIPMASEIGCPHIVLTNFPLECEGGVSYLKSLKENASKLFQVVEFLTR